jgi:thioredoxin 1
MIYFKKRRKEAFSMISRRIIQMISIFMVFLLPLSCGKGNRDAKDASNEMTSGTASFIHSIASEDEFQRIVDGSGDRLLAFDLYANWCMPCRILSPVLEKIAAANPSRVTFFKINIEKLPNFAQTFGVNGIPHIAFIKRKDVVETVVGLRPEQTYIDVIDRYWAK